MCSPFVHQAVHEVCLHGHHDNQVSNSLCYDITTAMTSLGNKNFSAPIILWDYVNTVHHWPKHS